MRAPQAFAQPSGTGKVHQLAPPTPAARRQAQNTDSSPPRTLPPAPAPSRRPAAAFHTPQRGRSRSRGPKRAPPTSFADPGGLGNINGSGQNCSPTPAKLIPRRAQSLPRQAAARWRTGGACCVCPPLAPRQHPAALRSLPLPAVRKPARAHNEDTAAGWY